MISDRELLTQMSLAARARFDRHPTWEQTARAIRSFLQRFPVNLPVTGPLKKNDK
jgi:hypothetical protein